MVFGMHTAWPNVGRLCLARNFAIAIHHLLLCLSVLLFLPHPVRAQAAGDHGSLPIRPLQPEDVLSAVSIANGPLSMSPDGRWLVYVVQNPRKNQPSSLPSNVVSNEKGVPASVVGTDLWLTDIRSGESRNLTNGKGNNWAPSWSPDSTRIAFYSDRSGDPHLWLYGVGSNTSRQASSVVVRPWEGDFPQWMPDGMGILTKVLPQGESPEEANAYVRAAPTDRERVVNSPDSIVTIYRANEQLKGQRTQSSALPQDVFLRSKRADLAIIGIPDGGIQVIAHGFSPAWYGISPTGKAVAFAHARGQREANSYQNVFDLIVVDLEAPNPIKTMASDIPSTFDSVLASFSPDGKWISFIAAEFEGPADCILVNLEGGNKRKAANLPHPDFTNQYQPPRWSRDSKSLYFIVNSREVWKVTLEQATAQKIAVLRSQSILGVVGERTSVSDRYWSPDAGRSMIVQTVENGGEEAFVKVQLETGEVTMLYAAELSFGGTASLVVGSPDGQTVIYACEDAERPPELWTAESDFQPHKQLTRLNPQLASYVYGHRRVVEWLSADGERLRGSLVLPSGYKEGERYPLVVFVYPGNQGSEAANHFGVFAYGGYFNFQLLATRGYAVLYPDCPVHPGTIMQDIAKAVLPAVNKVIELGIADPERLGVMGESFGGYATLSLIVQTKRFKAAMMYAGLGNLISSYGEMGEDGSSYLIGIWENNRRTQLGTPWEAREKYLENSPVFYLDRVQTPLLIVHGSKDFAVASFLADEVFVDLRRLGKTVVYAKYEGEGHALQGYQNQVDFVGRMITWLDQYLKN